MDFLKMFNLLYLHITSLQWEKWVHELRKEFQIRTYILENKSTLQEYVRAPHTYANPHKKNEVISLIVPDKTLQLSP